MDIPFILYCIAVCGFAAFTHGSIGLGFPMLATPLLSIFTDVETAIIITLIPNILINYLSIKSEGAFLAALKQHFDLILLTALGSVIGTLILLQVAPGLSKLLLALIILVYLLSQTFSLKMKWIESYPAASRLLFGIVSGVFGGLTNVMAPVLIIYLLESKQNKKDIVQSTNLCFLFGKLAQLSVFVTNAKVTTTHLSVSGVITISVCVALYYGFKLKSRISEQGYRQALKLLLSAMVVLLIGQVLL